MSESMSSSWVKSLNLPLEEDRQSGWQPYNIFRGSTRCMDDFSSHVSVLSPGITPHKPHSHQEEELLIMLSGEADIVMLDPKRGQSKTRERVMPGTLVYYPAFQPHTIQNASTEPVTYLMFKWWEEKQLKKGDHLKTAVFHYRKNAVHSSSGSGNGFYTKVIFDHPTGYLSKLHCHISALQPGVGYPSHDDEYDVAILLLEGTVETLGQRVGSRGVIFYAAGEPHGIKNVGDIPEHYLVLEFHCNARSKLSQIFKAR